LTRAIVTGHEGQDGWYLCELLRERDYEVTGIGRRDVDILDGVALTAFLRAHKPHEVYNLASPSFVPQSWEHPVETAEFAAVGVTSLLEAVRAVDPSTRVYQASSSEIFGEPTEIPQSETTPLSPVTPYGVAKAYGHFIVGSYRRRYGLHASCGILYNHESPRRPVDFLPSKVAHAAAAISLGLEQELVLGDLEAQRDWGFAGDYVEAMWLMLQQETADDYVIASGELHSVRELVELAFSHVGLDWREHVRVDDALKRGSAELHHLVGDSSKARERLGWKPQVQFEQLVPALVDAARSKLTTP
jgi:GDPmannose 4,6-dehydratase